ncbi:MAG: 16S rRNA (guanine(527)-N(7))-methyltransferase RsmG [Acidobacteria bacterium]|nr:16S rRNA (guanine(527)-N(7))-methyltransferase RsmG [Acidobacteriota bacterium]MBI3484941.1 16S rRNA (guanine(527)-N(7))-methyltransferase RsmG [Acidobacteriota bacterium]
MKGGKEQKDNRTVMNIANSKSLALPDALVAQALAPFGLEPTPALADAMRQYMELLLRWNRKISLTSITEPREILQRHFGESMFAARAIPIVRGRLVDVGSGAGFPGLALKLVSPELQVTLIEPSQKKSAFLAEVVRTLALTGVKIISRRIEDLRDYHGVAEFVTCRAVRADKRLLAWCRGALAVNGRCVLWLGLEGAQELQKNAEWDWQPPIQIPMSSNRVLLVGKPFSR